MSVTDDRVKSLLNEAVDAELGPRRSPPPLRHLAPVANPWRSVSGWVPPLLAAAVVAAVVVTTVIVAGRSSHDARRAPAVRPSISVTAPTNSATATPSVGGTQTGSATDRGACADSDWVAGRPSLQAIRGGGVYLGVDLTFRGPSTCTINFYGPLAQLRGRDGAVLDSSSNSTFIHVDNPNVRIGPGKVLHVDVSWTVSCSASAPDVAQVSLHPSNRDTGPSAPTIDVSVLQGVARSPQHCRDSGTAAGVDIGNVD